MKKIILLTLSFFLPLANILAHGGVEDGHDVVVVPPTTDEKSKVALGLGIFVLLVVLLVWWIRRKK
jgi:LPXTG-motif cell wall-anchored protein